MREVLLLAVALAMPAPAPTPIPQTVLPVDYPGWCAHHRAGPFEGLIAIPGRGVVVACRRASYLFTRVGVPPIVSTPFPGLPQ
jgi:hypothetical protein